MSVFLERENASLDDFKRAAESAIKKDGEGLESMSTMVGSMYPIVG